MNHPSNDFQLRFQSLFDPGRGYAFPCDEQGHVDLDALSEKARNNYLYARAMIGLLRQVNGPSEAPYTRERIHTPERIDTILKALVWSNARGYLIDARGRYSHL